MSSARAVAVTARIAGHHVCIAMSTPTGGLHLKVCCPHSPSSQIEGLMADMNEKEKKQLFAGSVPIGLNRNQVVIGEQNFNDNLFLVSRCIPVAVRLQFSLVIDVPLQPSVA